MNEHVLIVDFQVKPEHLDRFMKMIDENARASVGNEPGCSQFDVTRANDDPCHIMLYEVYANEDAFKVHMTMAHTQAFLGPAKDMLTKPPAATFLTRTTAASKSGK